MHRKFYSDCSVFYKISLDMINLPVGGGSSALCSAQRAKRNDANRKSFILLIKWWFHSWDGIVTNFRYVTVNFLQIFLDELWKLAGYIIVYILLACAQHQLFSQLQFHTNLNINFADENITCTRVFYGQTFIFVRSSFIIHVNDCLTEKIFKNGETFLQMA